MAFKPNYRLERNERARLKQVKKEDKLRRRQERKSEGDTDADQDVDMNQLGIVEG